MVTGVGIDIFLKLVLGFKLGNLLEKKVILGLKIFDERPLCCIDIFQGKCVIFARLKLLQKFDELQFELGAVEIVSLIFPQGILQARNTVLIKCVSGLRLVEGSSQALQFGLKAVDNLILLLQQQSSTLFRLRRCSEDSRAQLFVFFSQLFKLKFGLFLTIKR